MIVQTAADVYLSEADRLLEKGDVVQASEKYYKAAEEAIKLLAVSRNLRIVKEVERKGKWSLDDLQEAVRELEKEIGGIEDLWKSAILILSATPEPYILKEEAKKVRELVRISDKASNTILD
ncbi:hypothetical protein L3N51_01068 [Metallosphaera sp. J1]|uniref:PaREP1 family protein n=1 Tax=Metallosphaera TaxID=41980 RepID=UPI001EDE66AF|nr:PaREP1 family protein [Metallosphaera javensis (ex Hofmann et al. 2022)]MCG3108780.1 hypothetical protein [Metallosphaera javensis (ex Hofmann et al. 2022)]BCS94289.1 MAG: hypothetical protein MjAS7_2897 [Metallosphaera javensis (ex Sakai et al. 2022)]